MDRKDKWMGGCFVKKKYEQNTWMVGWTGKIEG